MKCHQGPEGEMINACNVPRCAAQKMKMLSKYIKINSERILWRLSTVNYPKKPGFTLKQNQLLLTPCPSPFKYAKNISLLTQHFVLC